MNFICNVCKEEKSSELFHKNSSTRSGYESRCKECRSLIQKLRYKNNWFHSIITVKRSYCKVRGISFNLTEDYLREIWTDTCPVFGVLFVLHDKKDDFSPTLDRLNPSLGYTKGNVCFISARANRIKYDATTDELKRLLHWLEGATTRP